MSEVENGNDQQSEMLQTFMEENFSRVFSLLGSIFAVTVQNEQNIRQILNNLPHADGNQSVNLEINSRELVENILKTGKFNATASNEQKLDDSLANEQNSSKEQAGTSHGLHFDDDEASVEQKITVSEAPKPSRKRKSDGTPKAELDPIMYCIDCNQNFKRGDGTYTKHLKEMKCRPFECSECKKRFRKKSYMTLHFATHSNIVQTPEEPKKRKVEVDEKPEQLGKSSADEKPTEFHFLSDFLGDSGTRSE